MEISDARYFGSLSFEASTEPEVWDLVYFDVYFSKRALALLKWRRWFLGLIGPKCTAAQSLAEVLEYIFIVSATLARVRPESQLQDTPVHSTVDYLSEELRRRMQAIEGNVRSFFDLYPDLLPSICGAANLASSIISTAMETEQGQKVLFGTKVPRGVAVRLAINKAREGFILGRTYPSIATSLASTRARDSNPREGLPGFEADINAILRAWEAQKPTL